MTALGPSFIKAGQVLASRPDIVRADYMEELCTLQDDVPSFPDKIVSLFSACLWIEAHDARAGGASSKAAKLPWPALTFGPYAACLRPKGGEPC